MNKFKVRLLVWEFVVGNLFVRVFVLIVFNFLVISVVFICVRSLVRFFESCLVFIFLEGKVCFCVINSFLMGWFLVV